MSQSNEDQDPGPDIEKQKQAIEDLLREADEIRINIFDVATTVIEQKDLSILFATTKQWFCRHWMSLMLTVVISLIPIGLLVCYDLNPIDSVFWWTARLGSLIAPTLPSAVLVRHLLKSGTTWFDEARLTLKEYEESVNLKNKQREKRIEEIIDQRIVEDEELKKLEQRVSDLQQKAHDQASAMPVNQYATLVDFVSDHINAETYKKHLGLMYQVKEDLLDLSNKLLPPSKYDPRYQNQIEYLEKVFPRGPARVVIYIDDLDRCPPERVIEVLEAVQLLVKTPLFIAVLAIDECYITRALEKHYEGVLSPFGHPSGIDYLEKIIQLPYRVRPIMPNTLEKFLRSQVVIQDNATGGTKFSEFSRQELNMLLDCCKHVKLSPRNLKRLVNVYKLFKIVCRTRAIKPSSQVQKATLSLLALSGRYPHLMRGILENIEACFEEKRTKKKAQATLNPLHLQCSLRDCFLFYQLSDDEIHLQGNFEKFRHDSLQTNILPPALTLEDLTHDIYNLIRSFSFVGEIGDIPKHL